jgi:hypothetical protein
LRIRCGTATTRHVAILFVLRGAVTDVCRPLMDAVDPALVDTAETSLRMVPGGRDVETLQLRWVGHRMRAEAAVLVDQRSAWSTGMRSPWPPTTSCCTTCPAWSTPTSTSHRRPSRRTTTPKPRPSPGHWTTQTNLIARGSRSLARGDLWIRPAAPAGQATPIAPHDRQHKGAPSLLIDDGRVTHRDLVGATGLVPCCQSCPVRLAGSCVVPPYLG